MTITLNTGQIVTVDNSQIKVGDTVAELLTNGSYELFEIHNENDIDLKTQLKVIKPL